MYTFVYVERISSYLLYSQHIKQRRAAHSGLSLNLNVDEGEPLGTIGFSVKQGTISFTPGCSHLIITVKQIRTTSDKN